LPTENELVRMLSVSRNSVREAVKSLETLGVLESRSGSGLFVRNFSFDPLLQNLAYGFMFDLKELTDVIEVRFHLELGMSGHAIEAVTPEQLLKLNKLLEQMRVAAERDEYSGDADRAFHNTLWENVDNIVLGKILDIFWIVHNQARQHNVIGGVIDPKKTYLRHVEIVQALEQKDAEALHTAMFHHYSAMAERLKQVSGRHKLRMPY
jgi:DNA-binding FadR family transcriptional regulator